MAQFLRSPWNRYRQSWPTAGKLLSQSPRPVGPMSGSSNVARRPLADMMIAFGDVLSRVNRKFAHRSLIYVYALVGLQQAGNGLDLVARVFGQTGADRVAGIER